MSAEVAGVVTFLALLAGVVWFLKATNPAKALMPVAEPSITYTVYHVVMDDGTLTFMSLSDRRDFLLNLDRACVLCESEIGLTEHAMIHKWATTAMVAATAQVQTATTRRQ